MNARSWQGPWKGYFFDLDGTLVDTAPDLHAALNHTLVTHGYSTVEIDITRDAIGHGARAMIEESMEPEVFASAPIDELHQTFLEYYRANICVLSRPFPTVQPTLDALAAEGAALAVVSNKPEHMCDALLRELNMRTQFFSVIGGDTASAPKPDAAPIELACQQSGLAPEDVLFVGDSTTDVNAAKAAGCAVVCVHGGYSQGVPADQLGADGAIHQFSELIEARGG